MDVLGYQLINTETQEVVKAWGGNAAEVVPQPQVIILPNGDHVCAPTVDVDYNGYKLIRWYTTVPSPLQKTISDRQFFQQAAIEGYITKEEALAAVQTGTIPASLQAIINTIQDENDKFNATMILSGATSFERNHPLVTVIGQSFGKTEAEIDQFFLDAYML